MLINSIILCIYFLKTYINRENIIFQIDFNEIKNRIDSEQKLHMYFVNPLILFTDSYNIIKCFI